jgi:hypothetical protein
MALKDELKEIRGIGDAKAAEIMGVVAGYESDTAELERALRMLENGNYRSGRDALRAYLNKD